MPTTGKMEKTIKKYKINGTALVPTTSRNGNTYTAKHITENNGKEIKLFYGDEHKSTASNVIGRVKLFEKDGKLDYDGWMMNTTKHPDAVQQTLAGLMDVSISAMPTDDEGIDIRNLHLVASPGVEGANVQAIMAESFTITEMDEKAEVVPSAHIKENKLEENKMEVDYKVKYEEAVKEIASLKESHKVELVESILALNKSLSKDDLMTESEEVLKIRKQYETKLNESEEAPKAEEPKAEAPKEEEKPAEEEKKEEEAPKAESEAIAEADESKEEIKESFVANKYGDFTMSESAYKKFNDELKARFAN
jgi:hypothetical protein